MQEKNTAYHESYMRRCFQLAKLGESYTALNPLVGAVLVHDDRIIGEGCHERYGEAHAEVNCINSVAEKDQCLIPFSTLYVSLEPCSHYGKTPPCTDLIIKNKIPLVIISVQDNFHLVNGTGIQKLKDNAVKVITGILEKEGKDLIRHFLFFNHYNRPYITLKFAQSKDGYVGKENEEIKISNELSNRYTHKLRAQHQAILVGKNTVLSDNPELTVRYWPGKNPVRVILSDEGMIPKSFNVFNKASESVFMKGDIENILKEIAAKEIISVLVEGGADTLQRFIDSGFWNEVHIITGSIVLQNGIKAPVLHGNPEDTISLGDNTIHIYKNKRTDRFFIEK